MNYRIRYRPAVQVPQACSAKATASVAKAGGDAPGRAGDAEAFVEANSPAEAIVKFRCTRTARPSQAGRREEVLSVSAVDEAPSRRTGDFEAP